MKNTDYTIVLNVSATPEKAFQSINNVTEWWTENLIGNSKKLKDEFTVTFGDIHVSTQRLIEFIPNKKVVWLVSDSKLNFTKNPNEWDGTKVQFEIGHENGKTQVIFTHIGLAPNIECYDACSNAWAEYIQQSLFQLIEKGKGKPTLR